ncbi:MULTISPECIES: flagellar motor protein MotB [unclassified Aureimonas]|uniref:flagellar motor protein MotB n=1 Tax=unclassified Aureimonas TaxID=2615206 RepID=UPI000700F8E9|nr:MULTISPECIES: flagellar motor protein MotB [unclassified Aureimonas]KQT66080.1 chemotaxis protein MotB [Aureimonas sp. Leaf427]KQT81056.1 chemotaxis protein MotB [Aureimonas sp. Leaf460]
MSSTGPAAPLPPSIIIVRRSGDGEDGHHGGAWKIAFADFMTAMMAFFLVMWLTSVSDDATKKQIQQYFNPIKLNSSTPPSTGLDPGEAAPAQQSVKTDTAGATDAGSADAKPLTGASTGGTEEALFRDPYAVLAEIAAEGGTGSDAGKPGVPDGSGLPGLNGGEAYRDPFDPNSWQLQPNVEKSDTAAAMEPAEFASKTTVVEVLPKTVVEMPPAPAAEPAKDAAEPAKDAAKAEDAAVADAKSLQAEIKAAAPNAEGVQVSAGDGGVTISLADSLTSGMFEIGSAKPTPAAIKLVETIAKLLQERKGEIVIRGHTDARPYAGPEYDNWRLSTARAHMAYYMLSRGGLDEARVEAIEGYGDRQLKDAAEPFSAVNRRIEILLKEPAA